MCLAFKEHKPLVKSIIPILEQRVEIFANSAYLLSISNGPDGLLRPI